MKFIGIPKTVKKKNEALRSVFGAILLLSLVVICVVGAESVFTPSQPAVTAPDAAVSSVVPTPVSTEMLPLVLDAAAPDLNSRSEDMPSLTSAITPTPAADPANLSATPADVNMLAITETPEAKQYYVTAVLSIRSGPGTEYSKNGAYALGDEVSSIASTSNGWKKLSDGHYVIDDFLSLTPPESELIGTYYAIGEINVRSGPGTEYSIVKKLLSGDSISVVSVTTTGWYRTVKGTYVKSDVCTSAPPSTPTPTPTPKPTPTPTPTPKPTPVPGSLISLGKDFKITFYGPTGNKTNSGTVPVMGRTVAVSSSFISTFGYGTAVYINDSRVALQMSGFDSYYVAEDTGGFDDYDPDIHLIDIFVDMQEGEEFRRVYPTIFNVEVFVVAP